MLIYNLIRQLHHHQGVPLTVGVPGFPIFRFYDLFRPGFAMEMAQI